MSSTLLIPEKYKESDVPRICDILSDAFHNDPMWQYLIPNEQTRSKILHKFFMLMVKYSLIYGEGYKIGYPAQGVAIWLNPKQQKIFLTGLRKMGGIKLLHYWKYINKLRKTDRVNSKLHKKYAPKMHQYLFLLAIDPKSQGKGYAASLIRPQLQKFDRENVPVYLETNNPRNVPIYEHFGFKVLSHSEKAILKTYGDEAKKYNVWGMLHTNNT